MNELTWTISITLGIVLVMVMSNMGNLGSRLIYQMATEPLYRIIYLLFTIWVASECFPLGILLIIVFMILISVIPPLLTSEEQKK